MRAIALPLRPQLVSERSIPIASASTAALVAKVGASRGFSLDACVTTSGAGRDATLFPGCCVIHRIQVFMLL